MKTQNGITRLSATAMARRIRAGELSAGEAVDAHIREIERLHPRLNAMVADRFDHARAEAREADARIAREGSDGLPLFHGVPCSVKESIGLTGMPHTAGLVSRAARGVRAERDATVVARVRAAGAIPLCVSNTSELCMWMESQNKVYGRTKNPYDATRTAGGSSGGEGALVGAGCVPFGVGADIGGSIRMPAFFNGVFGHKPSGGLIPGTGNYPAPGPGALRYLTTGPITRRAEDLFPLVKLMAGPDGEDTGCESFPLPDPSSVDLSKITVWNVRDPVVMRASDALLAAQDRSLDALARRGATIKSASLPLLRQGIEIWAAMLEAAGGPTFGEIMGEGTAVNAPLEILKLLVGRSKFTLPAVGLALVENLPKYLPARRRRTLDLGVTLRNELNALLDDGSLMLFPPHTRVAPRHNHPLLPPVQWGYTGIFNMMQLPATQVPLGLDRDGLPLGVQVVGGHNHDAVTLAAALALEEDFGGWVPPLAMES